MGIIRDYTTGQGLFKIDGFIIRKYVSGRGLISVDSDVPNLALYAYIALYML